MIPAPLPLQCGRGIARSCFDTAAAYEVRVAGKKDGGPDAPQGVLCSTAPFVAALLISTAARTPFPDAKVDYLQLLGRRPPPA